MEEQGNLVTLLDPEGKEHEFDVLLNFDYEGKRYAALLPTEPMEGIEEDEVILLSVRTEKRETFFDPIENPILLEEVFQEFTELFDEMTLDEDEDQE